MRGILAAIDGPGAAIIRAAMTTLTTFRRVLIAWPHRPSLPHLRWTPTAHSRPNAPHPRATFPGGSQQPGPEAGVWVIAETKDLPTNFIKIVVTDDQGRFMVPELRPPTTASSSGATDWSIDADSGETGTSEIGAHATVAKTPQEAARSIRQLLAVAARAARCEGVSRTGPGPEGNGLGKAMLSQNHYINSLSRTAISVISWATSSRAPSMTVFKAKPELKTHARPGSGGSVRAVRGTSMYGVLNNQGKGPRAQSTPTGRNA